MPTSSPRERMLAGLEGTSRVFEADGLKTSVIEIGDGAPLLLLHGGIECGGAMWAPVLPELARQYRVVAPDVPGLGESEPAANLDDDTFRRWLAAVIEHTALESPALVGHSLVGGLATRFATMRTGLISRLVVSASPSVGPYRMPMRLRYVAIRFAIRPSAKNAERFDRFALFDRDATRRRDPGWYDAFDAYTRARAVVPHVKKTMRGLVSKQTKQIPDSELARIDVPTALLWGRHDRMVPLSVAERAASTHSWKQHVIEDAAHAPHIEQPEAFVAALTSILPAA